MWPMKRVLSSSRRFSLASFSSPLSARGPRTSPYSRSGQRWGSMSTSEPKPGVSQAGTYGCRAASAIVLRTAVAWRVEAETFEVQGEKTMIQNRSCPGMRRWVAAVALAVALSGPAWADYTTTVNPTTNWGTWEGWGCSLAWWANTFGNRDDLADIVFTTQSTALNGQTLPGLGMNIARYNVGASTWSSINGDSMVVSPNIPAYRQIQGFWLDWFSSDPSSASWSWTADANQRAMLSKAKARGANLFELFSNSPIWWMCYNHNPSGADFAWNDNLQSWNYQQHAVYLSTVARYAQDHWGIAFNSVEPFNEPMTNYWSSTGTQEGCHFNVSTQATVIGYLRTDEDHRRRRGKHRGCVRCQCSQAGDRDDELRDGPMDQL
jgi:hypothetical protein